MSNMKVYAGLKEDEWLKLRKRIVTATEACVILGLDPWTSVAEMRQEKENSTFTGNGYTWLGNALEPVVVAAVNKVQSKEFALFEDASGKTIYADEGIGLGATPDATDGTDLLECKTTGLKNWYKWTYSPPLKYLCQLQVQLICTEKRVGYLAILCTDMQQTSSTLALKLSIFKVNKSDAFERLLRGQLVRYKAADANNKLFRVDRNVSSLAKLLLIKCYRKER